MNCTRLFHKTFITLTLLTSLCCHSDLQEIRTVAICLTEENHPFSYLNEKDKLAGFYVQLWKLWAKKQNVKAYISLDSYGKCIEKVQTNKIDIFGSYVTLSTGIENGTNYRKHNIVPLFKENAVVLFNKDTTVSLPKKIGILIYEELLPDTKKIDFNPEDLIFYNSSEELIEDFIDQKLLGIIAPSNTLRLKNENIKSNKIDNLFYVNSAFTINNKIDDVVQEGFEKISRNDVNYLLNKYFNRDEVVLIFNKVEHKEYNHHVKYIFFCGDCVIYNICFHLHCQ